MKWISDPTGRFSRRPLYEIEEIEFECQQLVGHYFEERGLPVNYPIETAHLSLLLEKRTELCDFGRDLSSFGREVEGVTLFSTDKKPTVYISIDLRNPLLEKRRRMTIAHELGHVHFHDVLFKLEPSLDLFLDMAKAGPTYCNRSTILAGGDWMEWQAAYAAGAILMPWSALKEHVQRYMFQADMQQMPNLGSSESIGLIRSVGAYFNASEDAARVRLLQRGIIKPQNTMALSLG